MVWGTVNLNTGEKKQGKKKRKGLLHTLHLKIIFPGFPQGKTHTHTHTSTHSKCLSVFNCLSVFLI